MLGNLFSLFFQFDNRHLKDLPEQLESCKAVRMDEMISAQSFQTAGRVDVTAGGTRGAKLRLSSGIHSFSIR